jgi:hypothetical protein
MRKNKHLKSCTEKLCCACVAVLAFVRGATAAASAEPGGSNSERSDSPPGPDRVPL